MLSPIPHSSWRSKADSRWRPGPPGRQRKGSGGIRQAGAADGTAPTPAPAEMGGRLWTAPVWASEFSPDQLWSRGHSPSEAPEKQGQPCHLVYGPTGRGQCDLRRPRGGETRSLLSRALQANSIWSLASTPPPASAPALTSRAPRPPVPPDKPSSCPHHVHTDVARASLWNPGHPGL